MNHIYKITSQLPALSLENMRVLLRADLNVPLNKTRIVNDFRLKALQPTLDLLMQKKTSVLLVTHIGRPKDQDPKLSTKLLVPWFKKHGYAITFAQSIDDAAKIFSPGTIVLLENIRFWPEEKSGGLALAHALRAITDIFVQDAFGVIHRNDTSITLLPRLYPENHRIIGLLVEQELRALNTILLKPKKPVLAIIGGAKIATKLPLINHLLTLTDTIALLPPLSLTCAHACHQATGASLIDINYKSPICTTFSDARKKNKHLILPADYRISTHGWPGPYKTIAANEFKQHDMAITIGPQTQKHYQQLIAQAKTIIFNGPAGDLHYPKTCTAMKSLFKTFCLSNAYILVAGGDSVAMVEYFKLRDCVSYCSSGGGASITYLSGQELVGLKPFVTKK